MNLVLAWLTSVDWNAVLAFLSVVVLVVSALQYLLANLTKLSPAQRNAWMMRAVQVAVKGVSDEQNIQAVLATANAYLKLHNVPVTLTEQELHLVLAEAELVLSGKLQPSSK